ncbi:uncharacterized protein K02A2.6-like [Macrobrachium nipponense]|uniref:uncharacterized protein K02A2.6-like n=1 Tax=Macrobrachium nipponense TaxID=159736 RepID=UPI0030C7B316
MRLVQCGIPILNHYTLDAIENPRLQRLKMKVAPYIFTAVWRAGKQLCIPDALSRSPTSSPTPEDEEECTTSTAHVRRIVASTATSTDDQATGPIIEEDKSLQEIRTAASQDQDYSRLIHYVSNGFPTNRYDLHASALPYWKLRDNLYADGGLVLYGPRIVIPAALRRRTLDRLHDSHRGIEATRRRAMQTVFWPGINADIKSKVESCEAPLLPNSFSLVSNKNLTCVTTIHPGPSKVCQLNFFHVAGKSFLLLLIGFQAGLWCSCGRDTTIARVTRMFCVFFREVGVPLRLRTDGGPPFSSHDFKQFADRWGVHHITSPHYPQANGHAEAAVKAVKHLIIKTAPSGNIDCEAFDRGLLELRNTPNPAGRSPAQILYGHPLRTCVPAHPRSFTEEWQTETEDYDRRTAAQTDQAMSLYNSHARPLPKLTISQRVRIQDSTTLRWDKVGIVIGRGMSRKYEIRLPSGRVWLRNRRHLRPVANMSDDTSPQVPVSPCFGQEREPSFEPSNVPRHSPRLAQRN